VSREFDIDKMDVPVWFSTEADVLTTAAGASPGPTARADATLPAVIASDAHRTISKISAAWFAFNE